MKIFIDLKGKKKEGKGVEFPIQGEAGSSGLSSPNFASKDASEEQSKKLDKKQPKYPVPGDSCLQVIWIWWQWKRWPGFNDTGSVNIAYKWDESDQMHIEYNIPLELLGKSSSLDKKELSIGWKINGFDRPEGLHNSENAGNGEGGGYQRGAHCWGRWARGSIMVVEAAGASEQNLKLLIRKLILRKWERTKHLDEIYCDGPCFAKGILNGTKVGFVYALHG